MPQSSMTRNVHVPSSGSQVFRSTDRAHGVWSRGQGEGVREAVAVYGRMDLTSPHFKDGGEDLTSFFLSSFLSSVDFLFSFVSRLS